MIDLEQFRRLVAGKSIVLQVRSPEINATQLQEVEIALSDIGWVPMLKAIHDMLVDSRLDQKK